MRTRLQETGLKSQFYHVLTENFRSPTAVSCSITPRTAGGHGWYCTTTQPPDSAVSTFIALVILMSAPITSAMLPTWLFVTLRMAIVLTLQDRLSAYCPLVLSRWDATSVVAQTW